MLPSSGHGLIDRNGKMGKTLKYGEKHHWKNK